jgi:hypothetical protein
MNNVHLWIPLGNPVLNPSKDQWSLDLARGLPSSLRRAGHATLVLSGGVSMDW